LDLFWTIVVILLVLWLIGIVTGIGGLLINILIVAAIIIVVYRLLRGKNVVTGK